MKAMKTKVVSSTKCVESSVEKDFASVFGLISRRRNRALMTVNVEMLMTYWEIGAFLSPRIHTGSWSTAVVGQLADYIKRQDPTLRGYSKSNLYNMSKVYDVFCTDAFQELSAKHQRRLLPPGDIFQLPTGKSSEMWDPVMVAQYRRQFIPKEVLQRTFEEYLALPDVSQD